MELSTEQVKSLASDGIIGLKPLCDSANVNYKNLYKRLSRGADVRPDEGEALGSALVAAMPAGFLCFCVEGKGMRDEV